MNLSTHTRPDSNQSNQNITRVNVENNTSKCNSNNCTNVFNFICELCNGKYCNSHKYNNPEVTINMCKNCNIKNTF